MSIKRIVSRVGAPLSTQQSAIRSYWAGVLAMPHAWAHKADSLRQAFEAIADASNVKRSLDYDVRDQALMLAAMAIEAYLKAMIVLDKTIVLAVTSHQPTEASHEKLKKVFFSHNLVALSSLAKVQLSTVQLRQARTLSAFIEWRGRYVMPTSRGLETLRPRRGSTGLRTQAHAAISVQHARSFTNDVLIHARARIYGSGEASPSAASTPETG